MSNPDRIDLRKLPPVEPLERRPSRLSQTALKHADACPRSGYLYLKHRGGAANHPLDRGSALHVFAERMVLELIRQQEASLYAPQPGEDEDVARRQVASLTHAMVDEILRERTDLVVPASEADAIRAMAYNLAVGFDVDPQTVVGVERMFGMEIAGWWVIGKIDLASLPGVHMAQVDDYKTSLHVPTQEEFESAFQTRLYALLLMFGVPLDGDDLTPGEPVGEFLTHVRARMLYPRRLRQDGRVFYRDMTYSRLELEAFRGDVERLVQRVEQGLDTGDWPARYGPHCTECPAEPECPLPKHLRSFHGAINTDEQAGEALAWAMRMKDRVSSTEKEVKEYVKSTGRPLVVDGMSFGFETRVSRQLRSRGGRSDWEGLEGAVQEAVQYGAPFAIEDFVIERASNTFKGRPLVADELEIGEADDGRSDDPAERERQRDEQFGADAPF